MPATVVLLGYEAQLATRGLGGQLQIPADPAIDGRRRDDHRPGGA